MTLTMTLLTVNVQVTLKKIVRKSWKIHELTLLPFQKKNEVPDGINICPSRCRTTTDDPHPNFFQFAIVVGRYLIFDGQNATNFAMTKTVTENGFRCTCN